MTTPVQQDSRWQPRFYTIVAGQAFSLIGSSAAQFALIWWLSTQTGSAMVLALAGLASFLPLLLVGPFAGVFVDRHRLKAILIAADLFVALCAAVFAGFALFGTPTAVLAYALLFLRAVGSAFHTPAIQKAVPMLVPADSLMRANGVSQFLQSGSFMLGPVFGAALFAIWPLWLIMLVDVLGALIASASVAAVSIPDPPRAADTAPKLWKEMQEGAKALFSIKPLFVLTLSATLCMCMYLPLSSFYPLMTSLHFRGTAWHASFVEFVYAGGMMVISLLISLKADVRNKLRMAHAGLFLLGLTALFCGLLPADMRYFWIYAVLCCLMGASGSVFNIPYTAYMQLHVPPDAMGRVFSLIGSLMSLAMPIGLLVAGPVAETLGVPFWFLFSGIGTVAATLVSYAIVARMPHEELPAPGAA